jgi:ferric-dicitrate binding protein FerR (iron transport regulator)
LTSAPRHRAPHCLGLALLVFAGVFAGGCNGCAKDDSVATLIKSDKLVELSRADNPKAWSNSPRDAKFHLGDGVRTGEKGMAVLALRGGSTLELEPNTVVRFLKSDKPEKPFLIEVEVGKAVLKFGGKNVALDAVVGSAILEAGTTVEVATINGKTQILVAVGSAVLLNEDGTEQGTLQAGGAFFVGEAVLIAPIDAGPPDAGPADAAPLDAAPPVTVSATVKGRKVQLKRPNQDAWERIRAGKHELELGSQLKLPRRSSMGLTFGAQRATVRGVATFTLGGPNGELIDASSGSATIDSNPDGKVAVKVAGGTVEARARRGGSGATLNISKRKTNIRVNKGIIDVLARGGRNELLIGETGELASNGLLKISNQAPKFSDMSVEAGSSATIHDPKGKTALRINFSGICSGGEGRVELTRRRRSAQIASVSEGKGSASVWADQGSNKYAVRCLADGEAGGVTASGTINVRRDRCIADIPRKPGFSDVRADGRNHKVTYQNLLPRIQFLWPNAPAAPSYTLSIEPVSGGSDSATVTVKKPEHTFKPGKFREGTYRWFYKASTGQKSRITTFRLMFDNAAAKVSVRHPRPKSSWGGPIRVAGTAVRGMKVSVGGKQLKLDGQNRFDETVSAPSTRALAIRVSSPKHGVHYCLRRKR